MELPIAEIEYRLTPDDHVHFVRVYAQSRFKNPLFPAQLQLTAWGFVTVAAIALALWMHFTGRYARGMVRATLPLVSILCWKGYQGYTAYRSAHNAIYKEYRFEERRVLRAYRTNLMITRPGMTELSIDWDIVTRVYLDRHFLRIFTVERMAVWIPVRFVAPDQWDALRKFWAKDEENTAAYDAQAQ